MPSHHQTYVIPYEGHNISCRDDGWFNATEAAAKYGKKPVEWLRLDETVRYLAELGNALKVSQAHLYSTKHGRHGGTWMHPKLAVVFGRWLDVRFSVWIDMQIDQIIRGQIKWHSARDMAASAAKLQCAMLVEVRKADGKACANHHFMNEHRMVNAAMNGRFEGVDRDQLSAEDLDLLGHLQVYNSMLLARGHSYDQRKTMVHTEAITWRKQRGLPFSADDLPKAA